MMAIYCDASQWACWQKKHQQEPQKNFLMEVTCVHQSKTSHHVPPVHFSSQTCFRLFIVFSGVSNTLVNHSCTAVADVRITCCELGSAICLSVDSGSCPFGHCAWGCLGLLPLCTLLLHLVEVTRRARDLEGVFRLVRSWSCDLCITGELLGLALFDSTFTFVAGDFGIARWIGYLTS